MLVVGERRLVPASSVRGLVRLVDQAMAGCRPGHVLDAVVLPLAELAVFCELLEVAEDLLSACQGPPDPVAELVVRIRRLAPVVERIHARFAEWADA